MTSAPAAWSGSTVSGIASSAGSGGYGYGPPQAVVGSPFGGYGLSAVENRLGRAVELPEVDGDRLAPDVAREEHDDAAPGARPKNTIDASHADARPRQRPLLR